MLRRLGIGHLWAMRPFRLFRGDRLDQARVTSYARSWTTECPSLRQLKALPPPCPSGDDGAPQVLMRAPAYQTEAKQRRSEKGQARRFRGQGRDQDTPDFSAWINGSVDVEIIGSGFDCRYQRRLGLRNPALGGNHRGVVG